MLEPEARHLLIDALRPPPGARLDIAIGTTYSLDLLALMTAPVAFAMFDRQRADGSMREDPIAMLQALREHASRITLFCQAGQIAVPPEFRSLLVYLEDSVHPVVPPNPQSIFHPKVWFLRFRREDDTFAYRLLCLSRNLTFDQSWDTLLRLDGEAGGDLRWPELERFSDSLITMARHTRPVNPERESAIRDLGFQLARVDWRLPDGFDSMRFWPLGDDGEMRWPFEGRRDRMLVISPFVTRGTLDRLTRRHRGSILVSRPEMLDALGGAAVRHLAERLILSTDALLPVDVERNDDRNEAVAEASNHRLDGLHAKTYVADAGWRARVWTGSANATDAAFHGNVEFMVELGGKKPHCGVHATIGDHADRLGLRALVDPYEPAQEVPLELTETELIERRLDSARRAVGGLRFTARCRPVEPDRWCVALHGAKTVTSLGSGVLDDISVTARPLTLGRGLDTTPTMDESGLRADYQVSEHAVTPYFVITLSIGDDAVTFLVSAELIDPPAGRTERVLTALLSNREDLIRFLLLLLGNIEDALSAMESGHTPETAQGRWLAGLGSEALLEPLVRAYSRDPERLADIERLLAELGTAPDGESILPERWGEIWGPISQALTGRPDR